MPVHVITDSLSSMPRGLASSLDLEVVGLRLFDGTSEFNDAVLDPDEFYARLADVALVASSSQPSVDSFLSAFRASAERGLDTLGVFVSSKMSGTIESARLAAQMLSAEFADARVEIVDSLSNSMQEGFAALAAAKAAQAGATLEDCIEAAKGAIQRTRYLFVPDGLDYLRRGGRIGGASALLGTLLNIRPILTVTSGETNVFAKVRSVQRAWALMVARLTEDAKDFGLADVVVHYIGERDSATRFAAEFVTPIVGRRVEVVPVSPVIGLHVGPAVGLCYLTERPIT